MMIFLYFIFVVKWRGELDVYFVPFRRENIYINFCAVTVERRNVSVLLLIVFDLENSIEKLCYRWCLILWTFKLIKSVFYVCWNLFSKLLDRFSYSWEIWEIEINVFDLLTPSFPFLFTLSNSRYEWCRYFALRANSDRTLVVPRRHHDAL